MSLLGPFRLVSQRDGPRPAPEPAQAVTARQPPWPLPGHGDPGVMWLKAGDVPLPAHPLDPVAFGPPLVADPTDWGKGAPA